MGKDVEKLEPSYDAGECRMVQTLEKSVSASKKLNIRLFDPVSSNLDIYQEN